MYIKALIQIHRELLIKCDIKYSESACVLTIISLLIKQISLLDTALVMTTSINSKYKYQ